MLDLARMERELSELLNKKVDLRTSNEISKYFHEVIIKESRVKYDAAR